jgi:hypothetical protein
MLNSDNKFFSYQFGISNYIYQISFLSLLVLLLFFSLNINYYCNDYFLVKLSKFEYDKKV